MADRTVARTRTQAVSSTSSTPKRGTRRPPVPGRRQLIGAVVMVMAGSFMPWVGTAVGNINGIQWAGLWTFYAAMLGLAGALVPSRRLAVAQAVILAAVAIVLPLLQIGQLLSLVGTAGWRPGPGVVLVVGGGVLAAVAAWRMFSHEWPAR